MRKHFTTGLRPLPREQSVATPEPPASTRFFTRAFVVLGVAELAYFVARAR